ncbi:cryptochrome/photolyase family protein [Microscilla marina]|uniref:Photolyase protein family n=1 Tax=Microscilla marina ATCC 23134 TaxID=313606 RepID=A1ZQR3_MICM2|nr:cryptochrome/photolyase family protein [Microscilla marina]EAY27218.1 photolyase protein family [Microscilla marina ATCC 23134]
MRSCSLKSQGVQSIQCIEVADNWLEKRIRTTSAEQNIEVCFLASPLFLNTLTDLEAFFQTKKKKFFQTKFYIEERKKRRILVEEDLTPVGGKWSFDTENRKKYPRKKVPPPIRFPATNPFYEEAKRYTKQHFGTHPGWLGDTPLYATNFADAEAWLQAFLTERLAEFGTYEDAIVQEEVILNHSVLTPMLNVGLLTPRQVIDNTLAFSQAQQVPLNSLEGFVRQIIGWREFIRGVYQYKGTEERTKNYWGFTRKIPPSFYEGTTGITPVDVTIKKVLKTGYCHHIERLMVLGNFMVLCEFDPDEVYRWFMELFVDAYDWVMVPNVYGMSQFADGGLMSTKPYISGSNYLMKMSNYKKSDWQATWDALFWRFMHTHRSFFQQNPRLGMLVKSFDKMDEAKQQQLLSTAEGFLGKLSTEAELNIPNE